MAGFLLVSLQNQPKGLSCPRDPEIKGSPSEATKIVSNNKGKLKGEKVESSCFGSAALEYGLPVF